MPRWTTRTRWAGMLGLIAWGCGDTADPIHVDPSPEITSSGPEPAPTSPDATASTAEGSTTAPTPPDEVGTSSGDPGTDEGTSGTTGEPPPVFGFDPAFEEISVPSGIVHVHGEFNLAPGCLIDQIGPGTGGFCLPERMTAGVAAADFDGDGAIDLAVTRSHYDPMLYRNLGDGTFVDVAQAVGVDPMVGTSGVLWADFDNDGDQDLYLLTLGDTRHYLYINDGTGHFTEDGVARNAVTDTGNIHTGMSAAVGDYDLDGWLDLYVAEWRTTAGLGDVPSHSRLLRNLGPAAPGSFEDVTDAAGVSVEEVWQEAGAIDGVYAFSPAFGDLDGDGWPDLVVVSDFGCSRLFWNQGDGTFVDGTVAAGVGLDENGMGSTFGDYDRDGDLDWFVTAITTPGEVPENRLYRNEGDRTFVELAIPAGVGAGGWGWGAAFFDADNDGRLDLTMANGYYYSGYGDDQTRLWKGKGDGTMTPDIADLAGLTSEPAHQGRGLLVFDVDDDGHLDLYIANNAETPSLYRNLAQNDHGWLRVRAVGVQSNRDGIGARVEVRTTAEGPTQYDEIGATAAHYMGQSDKVAHFGLGAGVDPVAEVRVRWPVSGIEQVLTDVPRNTELVVIEGGP